MKIRYVKKRVNVARFDLKTCHEYDVTLVFDVTACDNERISKFFRNYMNLNYPGVIYRQQRSKMRPGYAYVHFVQGVK